MKKHTKKAFSVLLFLSIMTSSLVVSAYRIDYAGGNSDFMLSGKLNEEKAGQIVTIKVENGSDVLYTRQAETNRLGEYSFVFNVLEDAHADVKITVNEDGDSKTCMLYKSTAGEVNRAIARLTENGILAAVSDTDDVTGEAVYKILQVDAEDFTDKSLLTEYISGKTFTSLEEFLDAYKTGTFLQELGKTSGDDEELYILMKDCKVLEQMSGNAADKFKLYEKSEQTDVLGSMRGSRFTSDDSFNNAFAEAVIIKELSKSSTDNEKWTVIADNNDYLKLNIGKYENSDVFTTLKAQLFEKEITSVSAIKSNAEKIYNNLISAYKDDASGGGKSSRNSGGGSVSASSDYVVTSKTANSFGFADLTGYDWAKDAILTLAADGIVNGKSHDRFAPGDNITRAEFAKIIIAAFGLLDAGAETSFLDVPQEHWSYRYVASAASKNIVSGISDTEFNPDGQITRQDMATICYRVLENLGKDISSADKKDFADENEVSEYAKKAVEVLGSLGIINGKGNGRFAPMDFATRAEAAKIIHSLRILR